MNLFFTLLFLSTLSKLVVSYSMDYGSTLVRVSNKRYGSGVESKYSSSLNSHGYSAKRSSAKMGSTTLFSVANTGIHSYSINYCTFKIGSSKHSQSISGRTGNSGSNSAATAYSGRDSGATGYSGRDSFAKGYSGSYSFTKGYSGINSGTTGSQKYNIFAPTMAPTESLPEVISPPPPSYHPTSSLAIPDIPLTFHINQQANGKGKWSYMPTTNTNKILKNTIAKLTNRENIYISNLQFKAGAEKLAKNNDNGRALKETRLTLNYNITTTIAKKDNPNVVYGSVKNKLILSINNGAFNKYLKQEGLPFNITNINCSPFSLTLAYYRDPTFQPTAFNLTTVGEQENDKNNEITRQGNLLIIIILSSNCAFLLVCSLLCAYYRKNHGATTGETGDSFLVEPTPRRIYIDVIPNPIQKRLLVE